MLVLGRKIDQDIVIRGWDGDQNIEIIIKFLEYRKDTKTARIGLIAPKSFTIFRREVQEKRDAEGR